MLMVRVFGPEGSRKDFTGTVQCLQEAVVVGHPGSRHSRAGQAQAMRCGQHILMLHTTGNASAQGEVLSAAVDV
jgi:hypothetical protein